MNLNDPKTCECGVPLTLDVLKSEAGYYIGKYCASCGPYMQISEYYKTYSDCLNSECEDDPKLQSKINLSNLKLEQYKSKYKVTP